MGFTPVNLLNDGEESNTKRTRTPKTHKSRSECKRKCCRRCRRGQRTEDKRHSKEAILKNVSLLELTRSSSFPPNKGGKRFDANDTTSPMRKGVI